MRNKKSAGISAKGYYIALVLCAVAIIVAGALYYRGQQTPEDQEKTPVNAQQPLQTDVPAAVTQPEQLENQLPADAKKPGKVVRPLSGSTVAEYSMEALSYNQTTRDWRVHDGIDIAAQAGTKVCAAAAGEVFSVYDDESMGMTVVIRHEGGYTTRYASLDTDISVKAGDQV